MRNVSNSTPRKKCLTRISSLFKANIYKDLQDQTDRQYLKKIKEGELRHLSLDELKSWFSKKLLKTHMDAYKSQPKYLDSSKILQTQQSHHKLIEYPLSPTKTIESIHSKKYSIKKVGTLDMKDDLTPVPCKSNISQQNFEVTITNKDTEIPKGKFA